MLHSRCRSSGLVGVVVVMAGATFLFVAGCGGDVGEPGPGSGTGNGTGTGNGNGTASSSGEPAVDAGGGSDGSASGKKPIGATGCAGDEDCESNVCFKGNAQSFCTARCNANTATQVCVAPLTGTCNKQGYCKRD